MARSHKFDDAELREGIFAAIPADIAPDKRVEFLLFWAAGELRESDKSWSEILGLMIREIDLAARVESAGVCWVCGCKEGVLCEQHNGQKLVWRMPNARCEACSREAVGIRLWDGPDEAKGTS